MSLYYVNNKAQTNGDHEVHEAGCYYMPIDKKYLGDFSNCSEAVKEARKTYEQVNGCYWCSNKCHNA